MRATWSRRAFLAAAASSLGAEVDPRKIYPSERVRYADPATEFVVFRQTNPAHRSLLTAPYNRGFSHRSTFLLYSSDRDGSLQAYRMDLKSGESRQLTDAQALDPYSLTLLAGDRAFCYFDGASLMVTPSNGGRSREIYRVPAEWQRCEGFSATTDGVRGILGEQRDGKSRLQTVMLGATGRVTTLAEVPFVLSHPVGRPKRAQVLYREGSSGLWLVDLTGQRNRKLRTAAGDIGPSVWAPDGRTLLYIRFPHETDQLNTIQEHTPDENEDKLVAKTSQFVQFGVNRDASVFVGASRNLGGPYVLLLVRAARREMTVCEHRATSPSVVDPVFTPDSQNIFFQTDRDGKMAIYSMDVEKLVEKTEEDSAE